jgi:uncharacterized protein (TIGR02466 family)
MVQGELEMKSEIATIFPVPIMIFDLKGHKDNDKLLEIIANWDEHKEHHIIVGGSSSYANADKPPILEHPELQGLKASFQECVDEWCKQMGLPDNIKISQSWFNVMTKGNHVAGHIHEMSVVSAAYYPRVDEGSVPLRFKSPLGPYKMFEYHSRQTPYNQNEIEVKCEPGILYLFPSWLEHYTRENQTNERITLSFNTYYR